MKLRDCVIYNSLLPNIGESKAVCLATVNDVISSSSCEVSSVVDDAALVEVALTHTVCVHYHVLHRHHHRIQNRAFLKCTNSHGGSQLNSSSPKMFLDTFGSITILALRDCNIKTVV